MNTSQSLNSRQDLMSNNAQQQQPKLTASEIKEFLEESLEDKLFSSKQSAQMLENSETLERVILKQTFLETKQLFDPADYFGGLKVNDLNCKVTDKRLSDMFKKMRKQQNTTTNQFVLCWFNCSMGLAPRFSSICLEFNIQFESQKETYKKASCLGGNINQDFQLNEFVKLTEDVADNSSQSNGTFSNLIGYESARLNPTHNIQGQKWIPKQKLKNNTSIFNQKREACYKENISNYSSASSSSMITGQNKSNKLIPAPNKKEQQYHQEKQSSLIPMFKVKMDTLLSQPDENNNHSKSQQQFNQARSPYSFSFQPIETSPSSKILTTLQQEVKQPSINRNIVELDKKNRLDLLEAVQQIVDQPVAPFSDRTNYDSSSAAFSSRPLKLNTNQSTNIKAPQMDLSSYLNQFKLQQKHQKCQSQLDNQTNDAVVHVTQDCHAQKRGQIQNIDYLKRNPSKKQLSHSKTQYFQKQLNNVSKPSSVDLSTNNITSTIPQGISDQNLEFHATSDQISPLVDSSPSLAGGVNNEYEYISKPVKPLVKSICSNQILQTPNQYVLLNSSSGLFEKTKDNSTAAVQLNQMLFVTKDPQIEQTHSNKEEIGGLQSQHTRIGSQNQINRSLSRGNKCIPKNPPQYSSFSLSQKNSQSNCQTNRESPAVIISSSPRFMNRNGSQLNFTSIQPQSNLQNEQTSQQIEGQTENGLMTSYNSYLKRPIGGKNSRFESRSKSNLSSAHQKGQASSTTPNIPNQNEQSNYPIRQKKISHQFGGAFVDSNRVNNSVQICNSTSTAASNKIVAAQAIQITRSNSQTKNSQTKFGYSTARVAEGNLEKTQHSLVTASIDSKKHLIQVDAKYEETLNYFKSLKGKSINNSGAAAFFKLESDRRV